MPLLNAAQANQARAWNHLHPDWVRAVLAVEPGGAGLASPKDPTQIEPEYLAAWQQFHGHILVDGMVGPQTLLALGINVPAAPAPAISLRPVERQAEATDSTGASVASAASSGDPDAEATRKPQPQPQPQKSSSGWILVAAAIGIALMARRKK